MYTNSIIVIALSAASTVAAHGKIAVVTGNAGGNGTAFGIRGNVVPRTGPNYLTEVDTTVYWSQSLYTNQDMGFTEMPGAGNNELQSGLTAAMAMAGQTLPQVTPGGSVSGTWYTVTSDGAGPIYCVIDPTATATFDNATLATVSTQVPGNAGNTQPVAGVSSDTVVNYAPRRMMRALQKMGLIAKRAVNIGTSSPFKIELPSNVRCTGSVGNHHNLCLFKVSNKNPAGPFGGVFIAQMSSSSSSSSSSSGSSSSSTPAKCATPFTA